MKTLGEFFVGAAGGRRTGAGVPSGAGRKAFVSKPKESTLGVGIPLGHTSEAPGMCLTRAETGRVSASFFWVITAEALTDRDSPGVTEAQRRRHFPFFGRKSTQHRQNQNKTRKGFLPVLRWRTAWDATSPPKISS